MELNLDKPPVDRQLRAALAANPDLRRLLVAWLEGRQRQYLLHLRAAPNWEVVLKLQGSLDDIEHIAVFIDSAQPEPEEKPAPAANAYDTSFGSRTNGVFLRRKEKDHAD